MFLPFNPNLKGKVWFFLDYSETVKAVARAFCSILQHFIRDVRVKFGIPNLSQSSDIGGSSDKCISDIRISGQFFKNKNCHNSRISHDNDMKLGQSE